ncbi:MAG: FAD-dependent oxidoreductase [Dehalococcoidia bacterium]|nr:FAD-dependent oxidoreductase [Dehalococcoidia bacterium]
MEKLIMQPIEINGMKLKNRIGMAPFLNNPVGEEGAVNDLTIRWFETRAKGGAGFIMTGAISPTTFGRELLMQIMGRVPGLSLYDDKFIPGFTKLAHAIHGHGARIGVQIAVIGPMGGIGPSQNPFPDDLHPRDPTGILMGRRLTVRELTEIEFEKLEDDVAATAARAKAAGIDCVELHCAHGGATLHCSTISPFYNRRTDAYGGNWTNRLRFAIQTVKKIRMAVGKDYPVLARLSADELLGPRGIQLKDTMEYVVPALEEAGVDCFDVSQGSITHAPEGITIPLYYPRGIYIHHAEAVKKATAKPVIGVGAIFDFNMAERFLQEKKADIIYFGRLITADPEAPRKYAEGKSDEIRKCIGCLGGCGRPCPVNYDVQDQPIPMIPADIPKKVLVIGGGVGGMEAARIATLRGHMVTLLEKSHELGGMVLALARTTITSEFQNIIDYLGTQMRKLSVDVRVCKEATEKDIEEIKPDVVIIATGSSMAVPAVAQGKPGVMDHIEACNNQRAIGQKVVIWGLVAAELALSLAEAGKDIVMIGRGGEETLARDYPGARRWYAFRRLTDINAVRELPHQQRVKNVQILYHCEIEDITTEGIKAVDGDGRKLTIPYDTLIISRERTPNNTLFEMIKTKRPEVYNIGDSAKVGDIKEAIWAANEIARRI